MESTPDAERGGASFRERIGVTAIVVASGIWVLLGTNPADSRGDTMNSRLATVYSLTEYGTFALEPPPGGPPNPFADRTIDEVKVEGRLLSSKPPVLPLLMTGEYVALRGVFGWNLSDPAETDALRRVMTITLVGAPYVGMVWLFWLALTLLIARGPARLFLTSAVAFGTQSGSYAVVFNNHVPAAFCVVGATYLMLRILTRPASPRWWDFVWFGLLAGLTATIDVPAAVFPFLSGLVLLWKFPRFALVYAAPVALIPVAVQTAVYGVTTGSLLPVQLHPDWYLYENSYWRNPRGVDALNDPLGTYLFHMTFGRVGLFLLYPVTLLGLFGAVRGWNHSSDTVRTLVRTGIAGFVVLTAYYAVSTNNYGGEAYGFRWYIPAAPVLLLMGAPVVEGARRVWHWLLLAILVGVSFVSFVQGARHPWQADREWTTRLFGPSL